MLVAGCGTIVSKGAKNETSGAARGSSGIGHAYTGIRCDAAWTRAIGKVWMAPLAIAAIADIPFSLVQDTMMLPVDLAMSSDQPWNADDACGLTKD
jgi:uncharacterized protein YceK